MQSQSSLAEKLCPEKFDVLPRPDGLCLVPETGVQLCSYVRFKPPRLGD